MSENQPQRSTDRDHLDGYSGPVEGICWLEPQKEVTDGDDMIVIGQLPASTQEWAAKIAMADEAARDRRLAKDKSLADRDFL